SARGRRRPAHRQWSHRRAPPARRRWLRPRRSRRRSGRLAPAFQPAKRSPDRNCHSPASRATAERRRETASSARRRSPAARAATTNTPARHKHTVPRRDENVATNGDGDWMQGRNTSFETETKEDEETRGEDRRTELA